MAPERLLVFELTGDVSNFARAATRVPGLEFLGAEDLDPDDDDKNPVLYPASSLTLPRCDNFSVSGVIGSQTEPFPPGSRRGGLSLGKLRDLRPWGPRDRVTEGDLAVLARENADAEGWVKLEIELVFPCAGRASRGGRATRFAKCWGEIISRTRIDGAAYHALLVKVPRRPNWFVSACAAVRGSSRRSPFCTSGRRAFRISTSSRCRKRFQNSAQRSACQRSHCGHLRCRATRRASAAR